MNQPNWSWNVTIIRCWNIARALQSPCCMTWLMKVPNIVMNTVFQTLSSSTHTCLYVLDRLNFEWYLALMTSILIWSWLGNGVTSLTVLSFLCLQSTTVLSLPFFFGIHSIGVAWGVLFISHQPAPMYCWILSNNCCHRESGHLGRWYVYLLLLLISGILWFTSCKGSSSGGAPSNILLYFWNHCSLSQGMSSSVRGLVAWMPVGLLAFIEVVSSRVSFGVLFLLQLSLPSLSVCMQVWELLCPSPTGTGSQLFWGWPLTGCLTQVGCAVTVLESWIMGTSPS